MATTNLFTDPAFKDGAFTANDPKVRAYALQKTMRAIDLGVELGAKVYVFWGGREGVETDAAKDPVEAIKRFREAMNFLCEYVIDQGYDLKFALEAKPNEPRGDIYFATTGTCWPSSPTLDHPEMVGVNPEVAHEHMAGLNFLHAVAQAWEAGKLFHIDLNDQAFGRYDQDFRFGAVNLKAAFFLVKFLEDVGYRRQPPLRRPRLPHRGLRGRQGFRPRLHAHLPDPQGEGRAVERRPGDPGPAGRDQRRNHEYDSMAAQQYLLGLDISTTGAKALLIDAAGAVIGSATSPLTLSTPRPLWSEQNPADWWAGMAASIRQLLAEQDMAGDDIAAIGLTGQMHGLVLLDEAGRAAPGHPVERPAHRPAVRRDAPPAGQGAADPDHRQRRADRLHRAQGAVGAAERAGGVCPGPPHLAAQGLHPLQADRRLRHGQGRRRGHDPVRPASAPLVAGGAGRAGDPGRVAAAHLRGAGSHRRGQPRPRPRLACGPARPWWAAAATRPRRRWAWARSSRGS
jgi:hypothetical protein